MNLADRVQVRDGSPQCYGTLVEPEGPGWALRQPIEDPDNLDQRRTELGLASAAEFLAGLPTTDRWYAAQVDAEEVERGFGRKPSQ